MNGLWCHDSFLVGGASLQRELSQDSTIRPNHEFKTKQSVGVLESL